MPSVAAFVRKVSSSPLVNLVVASALVATSLMELEEVLVSDVERIEGAHGMLLFGVLHLLKTLPDLLEAISKGQEGLKKAKEAVGLPGGEQA